MSTTSDRWHKLLHTILQARRPATVYIFGAMDTGKSTLCRFLRDQLQEHGTVAYIDCDPGQSSIGPPTTLGMQLFHHHRPMLRRPLLRSIGSTTPLGHLLPMQTGIKRLADKALQFQADFMLFDSSGFCLGRSAQEFQIHLLDLLHPAHIVALQRGTELESILAHFDRHPHMHVHRLPVSDEITPRMQPQRRNYREQRFRAYFSDARSYRLQTRHLALYGRIPAAGPMHSRNQLIGLCDREHFLLALGIVQTINWPPTEIQFWAPPFPVQKTAAVHFGSIHLDISGVQLMGRRTFPAPERSRSDHRAVSAGEIEKAPVRSEAQSKQVQKSHDARISVPRKKSEGHSGSTRDDRPGTAD